MSSDSSRLPWSDRVWWAREELNLRPLPCQQNTGNRCARSRSPRSPATVDPEGKRSLDVQGNALFHQLDPAVAARMAPPFSTDQSKHNASACIDAASIPPGRRPSVADGPTMRAMHELSGEELIDRSGATAQQLRRLVDLGIITPHPQGRYRAPTSNASASSTRWPRPALLPNRSASPARSRARPRSVSCSTTMLASRTHGSGHDHPGVAEWGRQRAGVPAPGV
jgi:hypothetical protein